MQVWRVIGGGIILNARNASGGAEAHGKRFRLKNYDKVMLRRGSGEGLMKILDLIWRRQKTSGKSGGFRFIFAMNRRPVEAPFDQEDI